MDPTVATPELLIEGQGAHTVVMIHGWPDTLHLWDEQVRALQHRYRCVRFTLPGFDPDQAPRAYSLSQVLAAIGQAIDKASPGRPVTLLLHDWGCFFGYQYAAQNKERVERVIGVDVGDAGSRYHRREMSLKAMSWTLAYQLWLALAWKLGGQVGDRMARWMARQARAPAPPERVVAGMGYPYAVQWFGTAGGFGRLRVFAPNVPMLFIYGERKPFMFHSSSWAERIASRPGCRVSAMPTGHWVMAQKPAEFNAAVLQWLEQTDAGLVS
jgi:pimeloyl-ACP methyl ester carboxylesterase